MGIDATDEPATTQCTELVLQPQASGLQPPCTLSPSPLVRSPYMAAVSCAEGNLDGHGCNMHGAFG
eukprot:COSAG06_NODE_46647_length_345_cov_0.837398_2_plen_65_part_01